jgi:hypothetical protein
MFLVDTSVWVEHLRIGNRRLHSLLEHDQVVTHPLIIGELACGSLRNRAQILGFLGGLPAATVAQHDEVLQFVEQENLHGRGIGWIDVHLLASARLEHLSLWTIDKSLATIARSLGVESSS